MNSLGIAGFGGLTLLAKNLFSSTSSNSTGEPTGGGQELIEGLVPGYRYFHSIILRLTGIDVTSIVTLMMVCLFVIGLAKPFWNEVDQFLVKYFTSAVVVPATDQANQEVLQFQAKSFAERRGPRSLTAKSKGFSQDMNLRYWYSPRYHRESSVDDDRSPPVSFYPDVGRHWFWFRGWPFIFEYDADEAPKTREAGVAIAHKITIRCAGWDPQPAKDYLFVCKSFVQDKTKDKTTVYQTGGGHMPWIGPQVLPSRPLETVELDGKIKEELVDEITHYLKPEVRKYYEEKSIPYRQKALQRRGGFNDIHFRDFEHKAGATTITKAVYDARMRMIIHSNRFKEFKNKNQYYLQAYEGGKVFLPLLHDKARDGYIKMVAWIKSSIEYQAGGLQHEELKLHRLGKMRYAADGLSLGTMAAAIRALRHRYHDANVRARMYIINDGLSRMQKKIRKGPRG